MSFKIRKISCISYYAFLIILLASCGKEFEQFTPQEPTGTVEDIYNLFSSESEEYTLALEDELIVVTEKGSTIVIPRQSLNLDNLNPIPDNIIIRVKEISKKSEMIKNNISTVTADEFLISERMFRIGVEAAGTSIGLKEGQEFNIYVPNTQPKENMKLFYGINGSESIIWEDTNDDRALIINEWFLQTPNGILTDYGYILSCDRFDWINIDAYLETAQDEKVEISINLPDILYNGENSMVFMVFENENSAVRLNFDQNKNRFYEPYGATPKGKNIKVVVLSSFSKDEYHFNVKNLNTNNNINTLIIPEKMDKTMIDQKLKEL